MLTLLQVITYMAKNLEYTEDEILDALLTLRDGSITTDGFFNTLGLETPSELRLRVFYNVLANDEKVRGAINVAMMRLEGA